MNVLITGITGNFGHALYNKLRGSSDINLFAATRNPERVNFLLEDPDVEVRRFDFSESETYRSALQGMDTVVLVRPPALSKVKRFMFPLIDACRDGGVRHILFLSLQGVERNRFTPHYRIEQYIRRSGIGYTFLRPGFFMENLITSHREEIQRSSKLLIPAGKGRTAFIAIQDIAAAGARCIGDPAHLNQAYELTGDASFTCAEVADMLSAELGRTITYKSPGIPAFFRHRRRIGDSPAYIVVMVLIYRSVKKGWADRPTTVLKDVFGIDPMTMASFIRLHRDYFLQKGWHAGQK
ncbi:MAG: NmrA family NAD(P)-binding protein [Sediminispirochaetaceae bacterium]